MAVDRPAPFWRSDQSLVPDYRGEPLPIYAWCALVVGDSDARDPVGIALTARLNSLVDEGLLQKVPYQERPVRHEYRLTDKGRDVGPILAAMAAFGDRWLLGSDQPQLILHHAACNHDMHAVISCGECGQPLDIRSMAAGPGPGYPKLIAWRGRAPQETSGSPGVA